MIAIDSDDRALLWKLALIRTYRVARQEEIGTRNAEEGQLARLLFCNNCQLVLITTTAIFLAELYGQDFAIRDTARNTAELSRSLSPACSAFSITSR